MVDLLKRIRLVVDKLKGPLAIAKEKGMIVEEGVTVMSGVNFGSEPYLIALRKNCRISSNVIFVTHDGGTHSLKGLEGHPNVVKYGKIEIGEGSFIGCGTIILPGVKVGSYCTVGAGSVVTKDVPDKTVVCGVPARFACTLNDYAEKCLKQMPEDFDFEAYNKDKKSYLLSTLK